MDLASVNSYLVFPYFVIPSGRLVFLAQFGEPPLEPRAGDIGHLVKARGCVIEKMTRALDYVKLLRAGEGLVDLFGFGQHNRVLAALHHKRR